MLGGRKVAASSAVDALLVPLVAEYDVYPLRISRAEQPCEL